MLECKQPCVNPQVFRLPSLCTLSTVSVNIVGPLQTDLCLPLVRPQFQLFQKCINLSIKFKVKYSIVYLIPGYLSMLLIPTNVPTFLPLSHQPPYPQEISDASSCRELSIYTVANCSKFLYQNPKTSYCHAVLSSSEDNYFLDFLFSYKNTVSHIRRKFYFHLNSTSTLQVVSLYISLFLNGQRSGRMYKKISRLEVSCLQLYIVPFIRGTFQNDPFNIKELFPLKSAISHQLEDSS